jgi:hypothetical protein
MTVQKILKGDVSDCIPGLPKNLQLILAQTLYQEPMLPQLGNREFVRQWVQYLAPEAVKQVDLVFPLDVDDVPIDFLEPNRHYIVNFGAAINNKYLRGKGTPDFDIDPYISDIQSHGYYIEEDN